MHVNEYAFFDRKDNGGQLLLVSYRTVSYSIRNYIERSQSQLNDQLITITILIRTMMIIIMINIRVLILQTISVPVLTSGLAIYYSWLYHNIKGATLWT